MNVGFSNALSDLWFDVLVQAKEVLRVVLLLDSHEPVVVGTERGFDRVFSLLTQVIQEVRTARERTHRIRQTASPFAIWRWDSPGSTHCARMRTSYWACR